MNHNEIHLLISPAYGWQKDDKHNKEHGKWPPNQTKSTLQLFMQQESTHFGCLLNQEGKMNGGWKSENTPRPHPPTLGG